MDKILVGITTYRRPTLLCGALLALARMEVDFDLTVLVADNDPIERQGLAVVKGLEVKGYKWPVHCTVVRDRGFTYGRNAILSYGFEQSDFDYIVLMDDDQEPTSDWLLMLVQKQKETSAHFVGSSIYPKFKSEPPLWARTSTTYNWDVTRDGMFPVLTGDGGILISRHATSLMPLPWYDHNFGLTGGADVELLNRLKKNGALFARARDAKLFEIYVDDRVTVFWALRRAFRNGNGQVLIARKSIGWLNVFWIEAIKIVAAFILVPVMLVATFWDPGKQVDILCKGASAVGKVAGLMNFKYRAYWKTYGN